MTLSNREKYLGLAVAAVVAVAVLDRMVIEPFMERGRAIAKQRSDVEQKLDKADSTMKLRVALRPKWSAITTVGGLKTDSSEAGNQMIQYLQSSAQSSGVTLIRLESRAVPQNSSDLKAERPESKFERIGVNATGFGSMAAMTRLLWKIESSPKLLKVTEIHIAPRKEATDDLQIKLTVATVSLKPDAPPAGNATNNSRPVASAAGNGVQP